MDYIDKLKISIKEWDIENFDKIYDSYIDNDINCKLSDITRLSEILSNRDPKWIQPHQFMKIEEMIILTTEKFMNDEGFYVLLASLELMFDKQEQHAEEILKMLLFEFENKAYFGAFLKSFMKLPIELQNKIKNVYKKTKELDNYSELAVIVLNNI